MNSCRRLDRLRMAELQSPVHRIENMTAHVAQSPGAKVAPSTPLLPRIDRMIGPLLRGAEPEIPVKLLRNVGGLSWTPDTLWPVRPGTVTPGMHLPNGSDCAIPDVLADEADPLTRVPVIAHLSRNAILARGPGKRTGFRDRTCQRFLGVHRLAGAHTVHGDLRVPVVGRRNCQTIDTFLLVEQLTIVPRKLRGTIKKLLAASADFAKSRRVTEVFFFFDFMKRSLRCTVSDRDLWEITDFQKTSVGVRITARASQVKVRLTDTKEQVHAHQTGNACLDHCCRFRHRQNHCRAFSPPRSHGPRLRHLRGKNCVARPGRTRNQRLPRRRLTARSGRQALRRRQPETRRSGRSDQQCRLWRHGTDSRTPYALPTRPPNGRSSALQRAWPASSDPIKYASTLSYLDSPPENERRV